jgi:acetyl esterase
MTTSSTIRLDPQLRAALAQAAQLSAPPAALLGITEMREHHARARRYWNEGGPQVRHEERTIPGLKREIPVVIYRPADSRRLVPVFVYLHGGGFKIGSHWSNDRQMRELAQAWGGIVVSADYLHVPENVFPSAVEETSALLSWLHEHGGSLGMDGDHIGVGGTSAGAAVAFGAAVGLGAPSWLRAAVAVVGAFANEPGSESMRTYGDVGLFPSAAAVGPMFADYLPDPASRDDPRANVLLADVAGFPPAFIAAAEYDVFRDVSAALASRLHAAGRPHTYQVYEGMTHLFFEFSRSVDRASQCVRDIATFLGERLAVGARSRALPTVAPPTRQSASIHISEQA